MKQIILQKDERRVIPILLDFEARQSNDSNHQTNRASRAHLRGAPSFGLEHPGGDSRLDVILAGENSEIEIFGLVLGKSDDEKSVEVYITHAAPNTKSNVNVRAVLKGKSTFAFRGNVKIEKGAKGADAYLRSDALLFDDAKMGDDTPALEILEKDVKAGHAATVGKVDEQMMFYLMTRGVSRKQVEGMLVEGFVKPVMEKILNAKS